MVYHGTRWNVFNKIKWKLKTNVSYFNFIHSKYSIDLLAQQNTPKMLYARINRKSVDWAIKT